MTLSYFFKKIEKNQRKFFYIFAAILFILTMVGILLLKLATFAILWIILPVIYFIIILLIDNYKMGLGLIGISFIGYYVGLTIAGSLAIELHVIFTFLLIGLAAVIFAQFSIHKIVTDSLADIEHRTIVPIYSVSFIILSCVLGGIFLMIPSSLIAPEVGIIIIVLVLILNTAIIGYLSKRFWASFVLNFGLMLFFILPLAGLTKYFTIQQFMWSMLTPYANLLETLLIIGCVFGGLFGLIGKYKQHTKPPITLTTPIDAGYVYRDRLSIMMLLGKNTYPEYEIRGDKVVFYNRMDVKMGFRPKHEIRLDIIDEDKCDVYLEKFAEREKIGTYKNPNKLRKFYQPKWNLLGYALKGQLAKILRPILLMISIAIATYFLIHLGLTLAALSQKTLPVIIATVSGSIMISMLVLFYIYISRKMTKTLEKHPEFSITYIGLFFGVFMAAWVISYLIQGGLIALNTASVEGITKAITSFSGMLQLNLIYLFIVTAIVGFASIQVMGVQNFNTYFYHKDLNVFKKPEDDPVWLDDKAYWVFRYTYEFPGEFTISSSQIYHEDIERIDVWVNAKSGIPEWLVGDYHWREIWTRIPKSDRLLIGVNFSINFHTPIYYVLDKKEYEKYIEIKTSGQLLSYFWKETKKAFKKLISLLTFWTKKVYRPIDDDLIVIRDPPKKEISDWTVNFFTDVPTGFRRACADYLANIPWNYLRYAYGVENVKNDQLLYRNPEVTPPRWPEKVPHEPGAGKEAMLPKRICPKCGYINDHERWNCEVCKVDVRKYSAYTLQSPHRLGKLKGFFQNKFQKTEEE
ncbi:MAG: hypothetical protein ACFFD2_09350 [Promethearchaeota archaeon]